MEPLPETRHAIDEYGPFAADTDLLAQLSASAGRVREIVPSCVGITLAMVREGLAFTLVATDEEVAALDGVQYLGGGPCVASAVEGRDIAFEVADPTDEARWTTFARATAARGVASTLTLPILVEQGDGDGDAAEADDGAVSARGSVNLYAAAPDAFAGHHDELAEVFGAWAGGAVSDADLDFSTREAARRTPEALHREVVVSQAAGALVAAREYDLDEARAMITDAARRAGVDDLAIAEVILEAFEHGDI